MILIQTGGLGFMTIAILFPMMLGKRIGLKERSFLMEASNFIQIGGIIRLIRRILFGTLLFETIGAILLAIKFCPIFGLQQGIWYGIFHSVSAFCNAGFDLMGRISPYTSLTPFAGDIIINSVIMGLIIIGGIGFIVWDDILRNRLCLRKYTLHTKIMLTLTAVMITASAILFFFIEKDMAFSDMNFTQRILAATFQAVTPRTAGFNTVDISALSEHGTLLTMLLMFIGAGPGSTAGGIKITTFIVIILSVISYVGNKEDINIFQRRLEMKLVRRAYCSSTFYVLLVFLGCFVITFIQDLPLKDVLFETLSAIGTVGLSTGITHNLTPVSRIVIILLMYIGS
jgi:trk system potassium uptake protein TrkH